MKTRILTAFIFLGIVATLSVTGAFFGTQSSAIAANAASQLENFHNETRTIFVTGTSSAKVSPDQVAISFAIESEEKTAQQATEANADITTLVVEALKEARVSEAEIGTSYYNVYPIYEYVEILDECIQYGEGDQVQKYCPPPAPKQILAG